MKFQYRPALTLVAAVLLLPPTTQKAWGQALTGAIVGNVTDSSGAAVPDAAVIITETGTRQTRSGTTNGAGSYDFEAVQPGHYDVKISKAGFVTSTKTQVDLVADTVVRADFTLTVGNVSESVTVSATAAALQTDSAEVAADLGTTQVESVPLSHTRNFEGLLITVPGYTLPSNGHSYVADPSGSYQQASSGSTVYGNNVRIDGAVSTQSYQLDVVVIIPTLDSIEAVNVATNSFEAQTGSVNGGSVSVTTKSGTNELHGALFDLFTSNHLKSRPFFQPPNVPMGRLTLNRYGGSVGGPVIKNKLFYFLSYEGVFDAEDSESNWTVPDALEKSGNFSESTTPIYDPMTGTASGAGRTAFPGNIIPASRRDPIAQTLSSMLPNPNVPGATGAAANNYGVTGAFFLQKEQADTKFNWNPTSKLSIFQKMSLLNFYENSPAVFGALGGDYIAHQGGITGKGVGQVYVLTSAATYILSPHLILDGHYSWETDFGSAQPFNIGVNAGLALGIPGTNGPYAYQSGWPLFAVGSYADFGNSSNEVPYYRDNFMHQYTSSIGWMKGAHDLRFGGEVIQRRMENFQAGYPEGSFTFGTGPTQVSGGPAGNQYNAWATFMLGLATTASKSAVLAVPPSLYTGNNNFSFYGQDRWTVSKKLTASLGVRWDHFGFPYVPFINNNGPGLYDLASNTVQICGYGVVPTACGVHMPNRLFSPSVGLAYRLTDTFVIRAGYGITQVPLGMENATNLIYPNEFTASTPSPNSLSWASTLEQGAPAAVPPSLGNGIIAAPNNVTMTIFPKTWTWPYLQSWNLTLQKQFAHGYSVQAAYVANNTIHNCEPSATSISCSYNLNAGQLIGTGTAGEPFNASEGRTGSVNLYGPKGTEKYYALQTGVTRRFSGGFLITGNWTWSKTFAPHYYTDAVLYQNVNTDALQAINRTHVVTMSTVYDLPFGKGQRWFSSNRVASAVTSGWKISSVAIFATGLPFGISSSATSLNLAGASQAANQILPNVAILHSIGGAWFNPLAFASVTTPNFGNAGYDALTGPGVANVDFNVSRTFSLTERFKLQFRADAANLTNTPHFALPGTSVSSLVLNPDGSIKSLGGFAQITAVQDVNGRSGVDERQVTFMLRLSF